MTKRNPTARAMSLACEVMENKDVPQHLRAKAKDILAEHSPEVLDPGFDPFKALLMRAAEKCKLSSIKPSDLKPAPADGKLVRDANALEWLSKAEFLIEEAKCSLQHDAAACRQLLGGASTALDRAIGATTDDAAISAIFTDAVKAEEAVEPTGVLATIHAVYEEFKPETMKGFDVNIDGFIKSFEHLNDAEFYARCNADRVARASSVDHYLYDKNIGAANAEEAINADTVRTAALKTLHDLMTGEYVSHAIRADVAKYIIESRIG